MRSTTKQIESLPITHGNFTNAVAFTPGVDGWRRQPGSGARLGGASQNNIMMDGISAMDTGNNGQMLNMNIESIGEVKVLTQGYQAEYGRSSGLQITAVTKSGTNQFHGSGYGIFTNTDWNSRTVDQRRRTATPTVSQPEDLRLHDRRPGGDPESLQRQQQVFFFYAHEFRPQSIALNSGNVDPAASADRARARRATSRRAATTTAT